MSYVHDTRFVECINCHNKAVSISDVPLRLFRPIYSHLRLQHQNSSSLNVNLENTMCIDDLHAHAADVYLDLASMYSRKAVSVTESSSNGKYNHDKEIPTIRKAADAANNAAIHFAYIGKYQEALACFENANEMYKNVGMENRL